MDAANTSTQSSSETIQVVVNTSGGKSINLKVNPSHTIANLIEFLSAPTTLPAGSKLVLAGKQLDPASTVGDLQLTDSSTLNLFTPSPRNSQEPESSDMSTSDATASDSAATSSAATSGTTTPTTTKPARKSNKPRCTKQGCKAAAQPIVGDCGFCQKRFCGKHRMLESHNCTGLANARQADKDRNAAKLQHERTVMLRGL